MGKFRGIDTDPGWINRKFAELDRQIREMNAAARFTATVPSGGNLAVKDGGSVTVEDGGEVTVDGATSRATMTDGSVFVAKKPSNFPVAFHDTGGLRIRPSSGATPVNYTYDTGSGAALITGPGLQVPAPTTSSGANVRIENSFGNLLMQVTSSRRYKQDIEDATVDTAAVLQMQGRTWRDRSQVEQDPDTDDRYVGFIAEELDELGLTDFVEYNADGEPEAIAYDRLSVALLAVMQDQEARLRRVEGIVRG